MIHVVEQCKVAPPPGTVVEQSIPFTFFDIPFRLVPPVQTLLFYHFPHPKTHFVDTLIPNLKRSLSLTLAHFYPLAANLIVPLNSDELEFRYVNGDSVSVTFAESTADFDHLAAFYPREADESYPLVPLLPQPATVSDTGALVVPLLAIQVTLFPSSGLCMGFNMWHEIADGRSFTHFLRTWASISIAKSDGDEALPAGVSLPFHDRSSLIRDAPGLQAIVRALLGESRHERYKAQPHSLPTGKVRATFVMTRPDVQRLKDLVSSRGRGGGRRAASTFAVTTAYTWVCILKSQAATGVVDDDEEMYYGFLAEYRRRLNPPLPETYFGNCLVPCVVGSKRTELVGEDGFVVAAELIAEEIERGVSIGEGGKVVKCFETVLSDLMGTGIWEKSLVSTAGSPNLGRYEVDFGWGRPRKYEIVSIDSSGAISLCESRDSEGAVEIGVSLPQPAMETFLTIFSHGLKNL